MTSGSANNPIPTLAALMENANAQWRVFDLGRKIEQITKSEFELIENNSKPYPYPIQQKARFAIVFWDQSKSGPEAKANPFIWFLQFDLDEIGLLKQQQRDHYISLVIKELGSKLIDNDNSQSELDNHPYSFTPDQNRRGAFNAQVKIALKQPASMYYEHVQAYFSGHLEVDKWQELSIQGIADFACRLDHDNNESNLIKMLPELSVQTLAVLGANLEHQKVSLDLSQRIIEVQDQKLIEKDKEEVLYLLRCLAGSVAEPLIKQQLVKLLTSEEKLEESLYIIIAGRFWRYLKDKALLHLFFEKVAENQDQELFNGLFSDLVAIPYIREQVIGLLRDPTRPEAVSRAIGAIFSQA